jgi:hypothetical protein
MNEQHKATKKKKNGREAFLNGGGQQVLVFLEWGDRALTAAQERHFSNARI